MGDSGELRTPLLHGDGNSKEINGHVLSVEEAQENGVLFEDQGAGKTGTVLDDDELENRLDHAIAIMGDPPSTSRQMPIDPFRNKSCKIVGLYNWLKTLLMVPILVVRVLMIFLVLFIGLVGTLLALAGYSPGDAPFPRWRRHLMFSTRCCGRAIMFCFGFHWIHRIGRPVPREVAPIIVSNHTSFIDPIFYFWEFLPMFVSSSSHDDMFMVGTIIRAMQVLPVDRLSPDSRRKAANDIKTRALSNEYPRVLLFPEGTTTNGRALISFKLGAFRPGLPVQPAVIRYPFVFFDSSWGDISIVNLLLRLLTQVTNHMEVEYLPVVYPTKKEVDNAEEFAARVRYKMAIALNVPETEHNYGDLMLAVRSSELKMYPATTMMVEMGRMEKLYHLRTADVKDYMDKFARMDGNHSGYVNMDQFLEALDIPKCTFSEKIFLMFDRKEEGHINFREFVAVLGFLSNHTEFASLIKSSFERCDSNSDGFLTKFELGNNLRRVFPNIHLYQVEQMFEKLDMNHDGVISCEEFQTFLGKNPELLAVFVAATCGV